MSYDKKILKDLIEGKLEWTKLKEIISAPKDADRFFKVLGILQEKVKFKEKIILPLTEHLYIVKKDSSVGTIHELPAQNQKSEENQNLDKGKIQNMEFRKKIQSSNSKFKIQNSKLENELSTINHQLNNYIVKCDCGFELDNYKKNWKHKANVYLRDSEEKLQEIYPPLMHSQADWMEIREFYCPGCFTLLETEALPPGYPVILDFVPDLEGFYKEILGCELP